MKRRAFLSAAAIAASGLPVGRLLAQASGTRGPPSELQARTLAGAATSVARGELADLAASVRGTVVLPGDAAYDDARRLWNGLCDRRPAVIVRCTGAADVAAALAFARERRLLTAVRGGGHSVSGKSMCDGGLVIDCAPMRSVRVDPIAKTARVEPGALLGALDHETRRFGLVTTSGTVSHTGAAGLTLGGGLGRVGRRFGLTCDNLLSADVLTVDGRFVRASEKENADLFWGLRGGGGNFGIVTSFEYRLHAMDPDVLGGSVAWPIEQAPDILRFFGDYSLQTPDELNTDFTLVMPPGAPPLLSVEFCWCGERRHGAEVIEPLRRRGRPMRDDVRVRPYVELQTALDRVNHYGVRHYAKSGFTRLLTADTIDALVDAFRTAPQDLVVTMQQSGGAIGRVPVGATAFPNRDGRYWLMVMSNWEDPAESERRIANVRRAWQGLERFQSGVYTNALSEGDDGGRAVYGASYDRLVALKGKYDPQNFLRLNANVQPPAT